MRIDLHTHSSASDGTERPADLVRAAAAAGLDVVGLTDHDTIRGWSEAAEALPSGLTLVRGAEISCVYDGISLHLLAYLFDPSHAELAAEMSMALDDRVPRAKAIVAKLADAGYPVTWELVLDQLQDGATVGRPHIADTLVAAGVVADRNEAFTTLLHDDGPFFVGHSYVDALRAVELVRAAATRGATVGDDAIRAMAAAGLAGLEVDHRDNAPADRERLRALAGELGLLVTGASDYHGSGKDNRLGEHTTDPAVLEEMLGQVTSGVALVSP